MDGERQFLCPRLIDYLTIVGARPSNNVARQSANPPIQAPELLRRYPIQDHKDFPMPLDMVYFCQPEGCSSVGPRRTALREASSFVFTLTDKDSGKTRYGICVNFYRPIEKVSGGASAARRASTNLRRDSWRKSMEKSSDSAFSSDYRSSNVGPSDSEKDCPSRRDSEPMNASTIPTPKLGVTAPSNDSESGGSHTPSPRASRRKRIRNHSLTSLCLLSHHPFFTMFRECLFILKKLIDACNESSNPRRVGGSKQMPRDNVWSVLTGQAGEGASSIVLHDVKEIETWILRLLSAPVPIPGKTKVEVDVLSPSVYEPLVFALPSHTRFSLVDFPLHLPLELLGVETCLKVLTIILLENKVVFQSRDYNALCMSVMAFVTMIYPLEYMFPVIPLLPTCMNCAEQLLLAPTPYVIGLPASFLMYKKNFRLPDDVWLVDLDSNKLISAQDIPPLPEPEGTILKNHLKQALGSLSTPSASSNHLQPSRRESLSTPNTLSISRQRSPDLSPAPSPNASPKLSITPQTPSLPQRNVSPTPPSGFNPFIYGNDVDSVDVATRVAMQKEDAEKALSAGTELTLLGNVLDCHKALSRNDMNRRVEDKKEEKATPRDSRNLYLVKEGVILAGTKAAEGVSATDMAKRLQLEQYKTQMLRNLNMYVARDRLVIHNVPPKWDDAKLRALFLKYSPKGTVIRETRIMRDLKTVDTDGRGVSKEFAFVAFTRHSDALAALRTLNNNPQIFSATKRPILAFSIENKSMVRAKLKRLEKSKLNNPKCSDFDPKVKKQDEEKRKMREENQGEMKNFAGVTAKPGVQKMRTRFKLKNQAKIHHEHLKQEKKKQKFAKKSLDERKQEFIKQPKQKMNQTKGNRDNFSQLVTDYKKKLTAGNVNKTKWYEG